VEKNMEWATPATNEDKRIATHRRRLPTLDSTVGPKSKIQTYFEMESIKMGKIIIKMLKK
jgi:hypothetical protein